MFSGTSGVTPSRLAGRLAVSAMVAIALVGGAVASPLHSQASGKAMAAAPCIPAGHSASDIPSISFGRKGGNIMPYTVAIFGDGTVSYKGPVSGTKSYSVAPMAVLGLQRLATAEGFATWPANIKGPRLFPDAASLFVTIRSGCASTTKTVTLAPTANVPAFSELFATLQAASGMGSGR